MGHCGGAFDAGEVKAGPPTYRDHGFVVEMVTELTMEQRVHEDGYANFASPTSP